MGDERAGSFSKTRYRNLRQYANLTDEQFEEMWDKKSIGISQNAEYEKRIQKKLNEFAEDYDVEDLKINDRLTLRALAQAYITLEDYEHSFYNLRSEGLNLSQVLEFEKINNVMSILRTDIGKMETQLGITRKSRKGEQNEGLISDLEKIKTKAREFYEQRMFYVFCPKCNTLLSTAWFLYPQDKTNKLQLTCHAKPDGENECGERFVISAKELLEKKGFNSDNIPDGLR